MESIYTAPFRTKVHTKRSGMDHTVLPANNTMPAFLSWAFTRWHHHNTEEQTSNCSLLLIYRARKDERLSWPGWLTYSGWFTHISGHPSATGRAQDSESTPAKDRRSIAGPRNKPWTSSRLKERNSKGFHQQRSRHQPYKQQLDGAQQCTYPFHSALTPIPNSNLPKCNQHFYRVGQKTGAILIFRSSPRRWPSRLELRCVRPSVRTSKKVFPISI